MADTQPPVGRPKAETTPGQQPQKETTYLTPVTTTLDAAQPVGVAARPHRIMLALALLVVLLGASALVANRVGREPMFYIGTPTATLEPALSFFPAVPTPDAPQHDEPAVPDIGAEAPVTGTAVIAEVPIDSDALAPALLAEYEGRYEDAATLYRDVLGRDLGAGIAAEAQWRLGIVLYHAGQYDDSIASFRQFASSYGSDARAVRAAFWAGRGHAAAGRPAEARAEFESYAPHGGPLENTALLLAADAAGAAGDTDGQRDLLNRVLGSNPGRLDRVLALERLAVLEDSQDHDREAGEAYLNVLNESRVPFYRSATLLKAARSFYDAGDDARAEAAILQQAAELPDESDSYAGLQLLLEHDSGAFDSGKVGYDRACRMAVAAGRYQTALTYCERFRDRVEPGPTRAEAAWYTAVAYDKLANHTQAAIWYQAFTEVYPGDDRADDALLGWGNALLDEGDGPGAIVVFDLLNSTYPTSTLVAEAQDGAAVAYRRSGDLAGAAERWQLAASTATATGEDKARALFWWGWALQQQGLGDEAAQAWTQGAAYSTFWGFRSADHLDAANVVPINPGAASADVVVQTGPVAAGSAGEATLYSWVAGWSKGESFDPAASLDWLLQDPEYGRAIGLSRVELWPEANSEYDAMIDVYEAAGDGAMLAALMLDTSREGWHNLSYRAALGLRSAAQQAGAPVERTDLPVALLRSLYPAAWPQAILREARERNLDPWLTLAMIRQESAYDPNAHSWADARGLMQVIPDTATAIAAGLGVGDFIQSDLYRPATAIRFGSSYLSDTLQRFDGNILYSLAGYNAGGSNVPRWAGPPANGDPDLFIENIDYPETREYLEMVYSNYSLYKRIYGGQP